MPGAVRSFISPAIAEAIRNNLADTVRSAVQKVGAQAVDRAVWHLGLGRQGVRLTGASLAQSSERWEAEVQGWRASVVAEAAELITHRALGGVFDLDGGESVLLESMNLRWLPSAARALSGATMTGKVILEWKQADREQFRRDVLSNLTTGAVTHLMAIGCDADGLAVVHVELEVRASARTQISGAKI